MGAWIETIWLSILSTDCPVAPHVGAWIETLDFIEPTTVISVAPHVGAWIETIQLQTLDLAIQSHPTWVRGLKREGFVKLCLVECVAPHVGAWIETRTQERGLQETSCRTPRGCVD